jgi:TonB family protein
MLFANLSVDKDSYSLDFFLRDLSGEELSCSHYSESRYAETEAHFPGIAAPSGWPFYFLLLDGVAAPKCLKCPNPPYPESKRSERVSGMIAVSGLVTTDGKLEQLRLVNKSDPDLGRSSLETLSTWRLEPDKGPDGTPVPVRTILQVSFWLF